MKKRILLIVTIMAVAAMSWGYTYYYDGTAKYSYSFDTNALKAILLDHLKRDGVAIPEGSIRVHIYSFNDSVTLEIEQKIPEKQMGKE
jgi:hypothetical protein